MSDSSLITEEARSWIGHEYAVHEVTVRHVDILRYLYAIREPTDDLEGAGLLDEDGVLMAPPMFYVYARNFPFQTLPLESLGPDGFAAEELPPLPFSRGMAGEIDVTFGRAIRAGDRLTVRKQLVSLEEKQGRSGPFVIVGFETEATTSTGEMVAFERFGRIMR